MNSISVKYSFLCYAFYKSFIEFNISNNYNTLLKYNIEHYICYEISYRYTNSYKKFTALILNLYDILSERK